MIKSPSKKSSSILIHKLPKWKPSNTLHKNGLMLVRLMKKHGFENFWVGGVVRDIILNRPSDNLDIATNARFEQVEDVLKNSDIKYKTVGKQFGTILAILDSEIFELTTYRQESGYSDRRHPDSVDFVQDWTLDAKRRDLTINALYFDPSTSEVYDVVGGMKDLNGKIVRFVGDPKKRIDEDHLRMLRAVRLTANLGFKLEKNSFAAIKTRAKLIQKVSGERVKQEMDKILLSDNRVVGLELLAETGLLNFIIPELFKSKKIMHGSKRYHLEGSVFSHTMKVVEAVPKDLTLLYASLFHDTGKITGKTKTFRNGEWVNSFRGHQQRSLQIFSQFAKKYPFSKQDRSLIEWLIAKHDDRINFDQRSNANQIKYALHPNFSKLIQIWRADSVANLRLEDDEKISPGKAAMYEHGKKLLNKIDSKNKLIKQIANGNFVLANSKTKKGPDVGKIIERLKIKIITEEIKTENEAERFLKNI